MSNFPSPLEPVHEKLVSLGVEPAACQAYTFLLQTGSSRATEVAAGMRISRDEAYRRLNMLVEQGLASATLTRPLRYLPTPPADVLQDIYRRSVREGQAIERVRRQLEPMLQGLRAAGDATTGLPFRPLSGREKAFETMHDMVHDATDEVLVVASHPTFAHNAMQAGLWDHLEDRCAAGVTARLLLADAPATRRHAPQLAEAGYRLRLLGTEEEVQFLIADGRILFFAAIDPSPWLSANDTAAVSTATGLLELQRLLFDRLWDEAPPGHEGAGRQAVPPRRRHEA